MPSCVFVSWEEEVDDFYAADSAKKAEAESLHLSNNERNHLGEPVRSGSGAGVAPEELVAQLDYHLY